MSLVAQYRRYHTQGACAPHSARSESVPCDDMSMMRNGRLNLYWNFRFLGKYKILQIDNTNFFV